MLSVKKSTSSLSFKRGDAYVKRDSNLYYASDCIDCITVNNYSKYLELAVLKKKECMDYGF